MRCGREWRSRRSEKAEDERAHQPFNHQPRVGNIRISNAGAKIKQRPERHANKAEHCAGWKEKPERFLADQPSKLRLPTTPKVLASPDHFGVVDLASDNLISHREVLSRTRKLGFVMSSGVETSLTVRTRITQSTVRHSSTTSLRTGFRSA